MLPRCGMFVPTQSRHIGREDKRSVYEMLDQMLRGALSPAQLMEMGGRLEVEIERAIDCTKIWSWGNRRLALIRMHQELTRGYVAPVIRANPSPMPFHVQSVDQGPHLGPHLPKAMTLHIAAESIRYTHYEYEHAHAYAHAYAHTQYQQDKTKLKTQ
jgi:hypothetical protein